MIFGEGPSSLKVDMSDLMAIARNNRQQFHHEVTFPDDHAYTGTLVSPGTIKWSNGSSWTKKVA